jgi:hypothetical protein
VDIRLAGDSFEVVHRRLRLPESGLRATNHAQGLHRSVSVERYVKKGDQLVYQLGAWPCATLNDARDKKLPPRWDWWEDERTARALEQWWFTTRDAANADIRARRWQLNHAERWATNLRPREDSAPG